MPEFLAPGVFVEEVSVVPRPISAVGTSTAAFFGSAPNPKAALRIPTLVTSWSEFLHRYVANDGKQEISLFAIAVQGFFQNGGSRLYIVNLGAETTSLRPDDIALIEGIDDLSLIAAPGFTDAESYETMIADCERRGDRFAVLDTVEVVESPKLLTRSVHDGGARPRSTVQGFAAVYTPWVTVVDGLSGSRVNVPPSGHLCGLYVRTDATRGVHKAPANAPLRGVVGLNRQISTREQAILNPAGVNCIRTFESGIRVWGARTLAASRSEFRYVPVRRLATMISRSIELGTSWAAIESNDQRLWSSLRLGIGNFLHGLWRDGALVGSKPEEAFFIKCDAETTTRTDIKAGRVNAMIGIAPLRPAEFVIIRISQTAVSAPSR